MEAVLIILNVDI